MNVWMSSLRRGVAWHTIRERKTVCGRYIGDPALPPVRGSVITLDRAWSEFKAPECRQCSGSSVRVEPMPMTHDGRPASRWAYKPVFR